MLSIMNSFNKLELFGISVITLVLAALIFVGCVAKIVIDIVRYFINGKDI